MNPRAFFEKFQEILRNATESGSKVFHARAVMISPGPDPKEALKRAPVPLAIIRPGASQCDPDADEEPDLIRQEFTVTLVTRRPSDAIGEEALLEIFDLEEKLFQEAGILDSVSGVTIMSRAKSAAEMAQDPDYGYITWRDTAFEAWLTM